MRTTIDIDEKLLDQVVELTGEKTKSKAVGAALREFLRGLRLDEMMAVAGTMEFDEDWDVWRRTELGRLRKAETHDHSTVSTGSGR